MCLNTQVILNTQLLIQAEPYNSNKNKPISENNDDIMGALWLRLEVEKDLIEEGNKRVKLALDFLADEV